MSNVEEFEQLFDDLAIEFPEAIRECQHIKKGVFDYESQDSSDQTETMEMFKFERTAEQYQNQQVELASFYLLAKVSDFEYPPEVDNSVIVCDGNELVIRKIITDSLQVTHEFYLSE